MKGDFTRNSFDPARYFSRVLVQQGRVTLDADFNEQTSILIDYLRHLTLDVFGPHAGPLTGAGFALVTAASWSQDVENTVAAFHGKEASTIKDQVMKGDVLIMPGRYYVYGLQVLNAQPLLYSAQDGYRYFDPNTTIDSLNGAKIPYLFYLDVWEQPITALEDDALREVALGGPDTCMRARVHWQVRAVLCPQDKLGADNGKSGFTCAFADQIPGIGTGKLRARARLDKPPIDLCAIPPESSYRGAENQLYRVEIHGAGQGTPARGAAAPAPAAPPAANTASVPTNVVGTVKPLPWKAATATVVWSRENGSVVLPLQSLGVSAPPAASTAIVSFLGRDRRLGLNPNDLVEVTDDALADSGTAGPLAKVQAVDPDKMTVTLLFASHGTTRAYAQSDVDTLHPRLIRWDKVGDMDADGAIAVIEGPVEDEPNTAWIELEDGVQIRFEASGNYQVGDYWLIPARVVTGDVEWPRKDDANGNPSPQARDARGERHYFAPLSLFSPASGAGSVASWRDCRCLIERLPCAKKQ
jgi:hypothetical protein